MRVLLVNLPSAFNGGKGNCIPLGIAQIAAFLEQLGIEVKVLDIANSRRAIAWNYVFADPYIKKEIKSFNPQLTGFSCTTAARHSLFFWASILKEICPECITVAGGAHITCEPHSTMTACASLDACVIGEGEITLAELADSIFNKNSNWHNIEGLVWRQKNTIHTNPKRMQIKNIDTLPTPARHLFNLSNYDLKLSDFESGNSMTIISSRGCVAKCKFCAVPAIYPQYRVKSAEKTVEEIDQILMTYPHIDNIIFYDDTMTANRSRLIKMLDGFSNVCRSFQWGCWSRADIIDDGLLAKMSETGCKLISFGFESGSERMLEIIGKGVTVDKAYKIIDACRKHHIRPRGTFILGIPGETLKDVYLTLDFIKKSKLGKDASVLTGGIMFFPGTTWYYDYFLKRHPHFDWNNPTSDIECLKDDNGRFIVPYHPIQAEIREKLDWNDIEKAKGL